MSKSDQIRALRERAYEARLAAPARQVNNVNNGLSNKPVVINAPQPFSKSPAERQAKWRKANTELNRLRAKEGMRKIRAQRENASYQSQSQTKDKGCI